MSMKILNAHNYFNMISLIGLTLLLKSTLAFTDQEKASLFVNCTIFNDTNSWGGEVCGTDAVTYANILHLQCINHQKSGSISVMHNKPCLTGDEYCKLNMLYEPVCGIDNKTYSNKQILLCNNYKYSKNVTVAYEGTCEIIDDCHRNGMSIYPSWMYGVNSVCASNGYTYQNAAQVKCLQKNHPQLRILHDYGCTVRHVYELYGINDEVCRIAVERYEWNPVCASDGATYPNPFVFLCFYPHLDVVYNGECNTKTHRACEKAHGNDRYTVNGTVVNDFTSKDEVCGRDGQTYKSIHHLDCRTLYNKYLFMKHEGACSVSDDDPCSLVSEVDSSLPVCGSDGISYISPEALWCAKRNSKQNLSYVHDGPC